MHGRALRGRGNGLERLRDLQRARGRPLRRLRCFAEHGVRRLHRLSGVAGDALGPGLGLVERHVDSVARLERSHPTALGARLIEELRKVKAADQRRMVAWGELLAHVCAVVHVHGAVRVTGLAELAGGVAPHTPQERDASVNSVCRGFGGRSHPPVVARAGASGALRPRRRVRRLGAELVLGAADRLPVEGLGGAENAVEALAHDVAPLLNGAVRRLIKAES